MKALVTGGAGFIGSHVAEALLAAGHDVTVVDDFTSGKRKNIPAGVPVQKMDVRDPNISTFFEKNRFDAVFHLAAQIDVRKSMSDPFFDASVNILGTMRLLECCRAYKVKKFIFSSSGGVMYGECAKPATEDIASAPVSPYGFSKATAERYVQFYGDAFHLPYTILRYGNVYGPRQDPHGEAGVVAIFSGKILAKQPVTIYGTGRQERDYVYVGDVAAANVAALDGSKNGLYNIGTEIATSVNSLYATLSNLETFKGKATYAKARPGELNRSVINIARAKTELKWAPKVSLEQGLKSTLDYFRHEKSN